MKHYAPVHTTRLHRAFRVQFIACIKRLLVLNLLPSTELELLLLPLRQGAVRLRRGVHVPAPHPDGALISDKS